MSTNPSNDNKSTDDLLNMVKTNAKDIVAYVLLVVGIILILADSFWGGFIVGIVLGYFYRSEIIQTVMNYQRIIDQEGILKSVVIGGALLALFLGSYSLFIGAGAMAALYYAIGKDLGARK